MIPNKPATATWTDEQWKAIYASGQDTLVSAAAGSGKTAVLVERMIEKVVRDKIDVDELLVVTFTNASAAEMRQRLAQALTEALEQATPENHKHLRRQQSLINKAQISTLHSFCLAVVKQYAYVLDIDPGFRIATQDEIALVKDDALATLLEEVYQENDADVFRLVDSFSSDRNDQAIEQLIERLYEMSRVHANPNAWLANMVTLYDVEGIETIDDLIFTPIIKQAITRKLDAITALNEQLIVNSQQVDGPYVYRKDAEEASQFLRQAYDLVEDAPWASLYTFFTAAKFKTITRIPKDVEVNATLKEQGQALYAAMREELKSIQAAYFVRTEARLLEEMRIMKPMLATLSKLVSRFDSTFSALKRKRGIIDFSDLEHFALAILTQQVDGNIHPSDIALDYRAKFKEVLVDEYQDVNILQETILQLVKSGDASYGNLFMVGDVKQSIVRP